MKTIIVGSDFSLSSRNAIKYASQLALAFKARLIVMHVYSVPVVVEAPVAAYTLDEIEKERLKRLKRTVTALIKTYGKKIQAEYVCKCGFAVDEIKTYAKEVKADLIVMGMQGAGYLAERLTGSVTTSLMSDSNCPVICVNKNMKFEKPKKIVLASDLKATDKKNFVSFLSSFAGHFKSRLFILNVFKPGGVMPSLSEAKVNMKLDSQLHGLKHSFNYIENNDVVLGINEFVKKQNADMVVMIGRKHSFFERLIKEPQTKKMAFHSKVPLLAFHD